MQIAANKSCEEMPAGSSSMSCAAGGINNINGIDNKNKAPSGASFFSSTVESVRLLVLGLQGLAIIGLGLLIIPGCGQPT